MLQHTGWLQISYISLYFDHFLFFFRSMFSFYSAPLNPISSLRFCKNTAGSVFSFYLLFTSFHASCLMVSLHLREDTFFWISCIIFVMPCCIISGLSPATNPAMEQQQFFPTCKCIVTVSSIITLSCLCLSPKTCQLCSQLQFNPGIIVFTALYCILPWMCCCEVDVSSVT